MIYSLFSHQAVKRPVGDTGQHIFQIGLGQFGNGRKFVPLTIPPNTKIAPGMNPELSFGLTMSGRIRIVRESDNNLYMILSAEGTFPHRGLNGTIEVPRRIASSFAVLAHAQGASGQTGKVGFWDALVIKAPPHSNYVIRINRSGSYHHFPEFLLCHDEELHHYRVGNPIGLKHSKNLAGQKDIITLSSMAEFEGLCNRLQITLPEYSASTRRNPEWVRLR